MQGNKRLLLMLSLIALLPYLRVAGCGFVFDDVGYLIENPGMRGGLRAENVRWAFTTFAMANWHPLTWLSHMADISLFGLNAGRHHLINAALHAGNTLLLFLLLRAMTGALWRSFIVAALFAAHPLHVESVAWISERKDLLAAFFFLLTLSAYRQYVRRPAAGRYLLLTIFFLLGLLAKPMVVTLPFVLLLLDYWPFERMGGVAGTPPGRLPRRNLAFLLQEKAPLLGFSLAAGAVTFIAQRQAQAVGSLQAYPWSLRWKNAAVSYLQYLWQTLWPHQLSIFYRHAGDRVSALRVGGALILLAAATAAVILGARRRGYLAVGWFWFAGMLLPVIGLVQVGSQAMADRYTYLPLIGIFLILVWGGADLARRFRIPPRAIAFFVAGVVISCMALSWRQTGFWRDDLTLFGHAVEVDPENGLARNNLGLGLNQRRRFPEALAQLQTAVRLSPDYYHAQNNLGLVLSNLGRPQEAGAALQRAIQINPRAPQAYKNLGLVYVALRDKPAALGVYRSLAAVDPAAAAQLLIFVNTLP